MNPTLAGKVPGYTAPRAPTVGAAPAAAAPPTPPSRPPLGSYDPTLDYQETSAQLGLADLLQNQGIQSGQGSQDFKFSRKGLQQQKKHGLEDIRENFRNLATNQTQSAQVMGVEEGGAAHAGQVIRGKMQDKQESRLKQAIQRSMQQLAIQRQRAQQAAAIQAARSKRDYALYSQAIGTIRWRQANDSGFPIGGLG